MMINAMKHNLTEHIEVQRKQITGIFVFVVIFYGLATVALIVKSGWQKSVNDDPLRANFMLLGWMLTDLPVIGLIVWMYYKSFKDHYLKNSAIDNSPLLGRDYRPLRETIAVSKLESVDGLYIQMRDFEHLSSNTGLIF